MCEALRGFSTAAVGACDVATDAVGKSVVMLRDGLGEAIRVEDRELVHRDLTHSSANCPKATTSCARRQTPSGAGPGEAVAPERLGAGGMTLLCELASLLGGEPLGHKSPSEITRPNSV